MKKTIVKYFFEFIVIVIGVSISFYAENYNDSLNKIQLKNQSLNRILENLKLDNTDNRFNYKAHSESLISSEWILTNRNNLSAYSRDTIGFHLSRAINIITYFVDNQEEYRTIQSSGYIEYIENESLVKGLQEKYVQHKVMKFIEEEIRSKAKVLADFEFKNSKINNDERENRLMKQGTIEINNTPYSGILYYNGEGNNETGSWFHGKLIFELPEVKALKGESVILELKGKR